MNLNQHSSAQDVDLDWFHRERPTTGYLNNLYMPIVNADEGSQGNSEVFVDCRNGIANPTLTPDVASKKIAKPMPRHPKDESLNHELVVDRILHSALPGLPDAEASKQQMVQVDTAKDKESKEAIQHQNLTTLFRDNGLAVNYVYMPLLEPSHGSTGPLVNGYNPAKRSSLSLEDHSLPSGIPSTAEFVEINHLIAQGLPDQIPSLEEQLKLSQGTIATQAKLIRKLHANIDKARAHMNMVTKKQVLAWAKEMDLQKERIELLEESIAIIEDNNTNLKIAVDFGVKILGCCFHREWALWQFSDRLENKSRGRSRSLLRNLCNFNTKAKKVKDANLQAGKYPHGYQWDIFGRGPEPSNSTGVPRGIRDALGIDHEQSQLRAIHLTNGSISKNDSAFPNAEKKALARMARLNMDLMNNDCEEWLTLVRGCRNRPTGIEDVYDDFTS
ncbi:hypothetical protein B0J11DRAFT_530528 [Dendryphion nanum]|uniref:Uncharacterized protein n=1 Tax=Dendryphion nanum TaxID=256645 RepID=A0A9P9DS50_9PLEO|nr:hypothetical protein B0J11DRAFT_530528 [Dendryphion nanum]